MGFGATVGALLSEDEKLVSILFFLIILLGLYVLLGSGTIEADENVIRTSSHLGVYEMHWEEIKKIETGNYGTIVLWGDDKRMIIPPYSYWKGWDGDQIIEMLRKKPNLEGLGIWNNNKLGDYLWNKNSKVSSEYKIR